MQAHRIRCQARRFPVGCQPALGSQCRRLPLRVLEVGGPRRFWGDRCRAVQLWKLLQAMPAHWWRPMMAGPGD